MIDTAKAKADAEEGLRIAEKATKGPWGEKCGIYKHYCFSTEPGEEFGFSAQEMHWSDGRDVPAHDNCVFVADSRARAPDAYRNVIALAEEVDRLRAEAERWRRDAIEDMPSREVHRDIRALLGITKGQSTIAAIRTIVAELARLAPLDEAVRRQRERDEAIEQGSR